MWSSGGPWWVHGRSLGGPREVSEGSPGAHWEVPGEFSGEFIGGHRGISGGPWKVPGESLRGPSGSLGCPTHNLIKMSKLNSVITVYWWSLSQASMKLVASFISLKNVSVNEACDTQTKLTLLLLYYPAFTVIRIVSFGILLYNDYLILLRQIYDLYQYIRYQNKACSDGL